MVKHGHEDGSIQVHPTEFPTEWEIVRKKWDDFPSAANVRIAAVWRDWERTGGGPSSVLALTPNEENVLAIIREPASLGISGATDLR